MTKIREFLREHKIQEVECLVPDLAGIARGKILPAQKFLKGLETNGLRIPDTVFVQTVTGGYPEEDVTPVEAGDCYLVPDESTIRLVPWYDEPTAQVICDAFDFEGKPIAMSGRYVLRRVLELYAEEGWTPVVAPELEFYLVDVNTDPDYPLVPPIGRSGRRETSRQSYGVDAVNEFDPLFEDVYDFCEKQEIDVDTLIHEAGAGQMEMNFRHGNALEMADQAFLFKRTVREAAHRHKVYATFMAKPMKGEPGSSMHIHQSVLDSAGNNIFANPTNGRNTKIFLSHIAGLQKFLPAVMPLLGPNVNSYRRLVKHSDAPINTHWGVDNRTVGLRVPHSDPRDRRIENRLAGADCNPYLGLAASLACGYLGMKLKMKPRQPVEGSAYRLAHTLPRTLQESLHRMSINKQVRAILGDQFIDAVVAVKESELNEYQQVISSWEREHLLLNV